MTLKHQSELLSNTHVREAGHPAVIDLPWGHPFDRVMLMWAPDSLGISDHEPPLNCVSQVVPSPAGPGAKPLPLSMMSTCI